MTTDRQATRAKGKRPAGTQLSLFPHLGHGTELVIPAKDAQRCANRWKCGIEEYREHLQTLLNRRFIYFHMIRKEPDFRSVIVTAIVTYVKEHLGRNLHEWYREPTDRKVTKLVCDHFRSMPEDRQAVAVRIR